ncbi:MAG TPA: hypothetical protein DHV56_05075 [Rhodobacter sp.]|nr:hypothetical protein [Rhodobacter sp.]
MAWKSRIGRRKTSKIWPSVSKTSSDGGVGVNPDLPHPPNVGRGSPRLTIPKIPRLAGFTPPNAKCPVIRGKHGSSDPKVSGTNRRPCRTKQNTR